MSIIITTNGEHRHDQSSGLQRDDVALSSDLNELPDVFENFLLSLSPVVNTTNAADYEAALESPLAGYFVEVTADDNETINDLFFSQTDGTLFNGEVAQYDGSDLHVVGSTDQIHLYSFDDGDILIGTLQSAGVDTSDPASLDGSMVVFAYYLDENTDSTGADVWGTTFQPLAHPVAGDDSAGEHDDVIDFGDFLYVSAQATLSFEFDTLESGKFLWVAVGDTDHGLLVTGKDLNVQDPGHANEGDLVNGGQDPSDAVNTSQGGAGATIGINNQQWVPGNEGVFTLVKGFTALGSGPDATGDNVTGIDYSDTDPYINTDGAGIFISQTQGNAPIDMTIAVFEAGGGIAPEEGFAYIGAEGGNDGTSGSFEDDDLVNVQTVTVYDAGMALIGTWEVGVNNGSTQAGITVTITGNEIDADGLGVLQTVHWTVEDGETFNRFTLAADAGKFDVGRVDVDEGLLITELIGEEVIIHDDGPSFGAQSAAPDLVTDDTATPGDSDSADFSSVFAPDFGTDGFKDSDGNDIEDTDAVTYALGISVPNADSGLTDTLSNEAVVLTMDGLDVVGETASGGDEVFRISVNINSGEVTQTQTRSVVHNDDGDHEETGASAATLTAANLITLTATAEDGDGDTATDTANIAQSFHFEDDGPTAAITDTGVVVVHDESAGEQNDVTAFREDGNDDDQSLATIPPLLAEILNQAVGVDGWAASNGAVVSSAGTTFGADGAATGDSVVWSLDVPLANTDSGIDTRDGYNILLNVETVILDLGEGPTEFEVVVGRADADGDGVVSKEAGDEAAIGVGIREDGQLIVVQFFPLLHPDDGDPDEVLTMNDDAIRAVLTVTDGDGDTDSVWESIGDKVNFEDDRPLIARFADGTEDPISDGLVDFTTIDGANPDDQGGSSVVSVTNTLKGIVGSDANDDSNQAGDGTKTYTFTSFTTDTTAIADLQGELSEDGTRIVYYTDGEGGTANEFDGADTLYYDIVLNQTDNSGAGSYTFTVHQSPPPENIEFDFNDLPSGQNLHGTISADKSDLAEGGLLLFPKYTDLDSDGEMTNSSPTTNTSKGGGPVTIGNANQMFNPGEGHYFVYVDDPDEDAIAGLGLDQNSADDADTVGFDGTLEFDSAEIEIVQVQGGSPAAMQITSYDLDLSGAVGAGDTIDPRDFLTNPEATTSEYSSTKVDILAVRVYDGSDPDNLVLLEEEAVSDGGTPTTDDGGDIDIVFNDGSVDVFGIDDDYVIQWETDGTHDMSLVEGLEGKYDIGGFNFVEGQDTPDQTFDFTVQVIDSDLDTDQSNTFTVDVDGTGIYDDDAYDLFL